MKKALAGTAPVENLFRRNSIIILARAKLEVNEKPPRLTQGVFLFLANI